MSSPQQTGKAAHVAAEKDMKVAIPPRLAAIKAEAAASTPPGAAPAGSMTPGGGPMSPFTQLDAAQHQDGGLFEPEVTPQQMEHARRLEQVFAECDRDGDGYIDTNTELRYLIQKWYRPTDSEVALFIKKFDQNKDQMISFDEYLAANVQSRPATGGVATKDNRTADPKIVAEIKAEFAALDLDGDGKLGLEDVRALVQRRYVPPEYVVRRFQVALDKNKDGKISHAELAAAYDEVQKHLLSFYEEQRPATTRPGTQTHIARLSHLFAECDAAHTGYIDKRELQYLIQKWYDATADDIAALLKRLEALAPDGRITLAHYLEAVSTGQRAGATVRFDIEARLKAHIEADWKAHDRTGAGWLSPAAVADVARHCFVAPPHVYDRFRTLLDVDRDGRVTFAELVAAYDKHMLPRLSVTGGIDAKALAAAVASVTAAADAKADDSKDKPATAAAAAAAPAPAAAAPAAAPAAAAPAAAPATTPAPAPAPAAAASK